MRCPSFCTGPRRRQTCVQFQRFRMAAISLRYSFIRALKVRRTLVQTRVCGEPTRSVTWVISSRCRSIIRVEMAARLVLDAKTMNVLDRMASKGQ